MKKTYLLILISLLLGTGVIADDSVKEDIFKKFADDTITFFAPISGLVVDVNGDDAEISIGLAEGVRNGMRLEVFREGDKFKHPVTGEVLGKIESEVGNVEVTNTEEKKSRVNILHGEIQVGDRVRISKGTLKMLFYQTRSVDWSVGDALYRKFKDAGRFEIVETEKDYEDTDAMLREVKKHKSIFGIYVRQYRVEDKEMLEVSLYHPDGARFYNRTEELPAEKLKELKFEYSFLKEVDASFQLSFDVPSSTDLLSACDIDGDGTDEIVMIIGTEIEVFRFGVDLKLLYFREIGRLNEIIWLDCYDLDGDKKSEILVTSVVGDIIDDEADEGMSEAKLMQVSDKGTVSEVFSLEHEELIRKTKTYGFMRIINGSLYYQAFSARDGYSGDIFLMEYEDGWKQDRPVKLPGGTNIYDFMQVKIDGSDGYLVIDDSAYINLFNSDSLRIWRSKDKAGGFIKEYELPAQSILVQPEKWYVKDRIVPYKGNYIMIKRESVADNAPGLGFTSADIIGMKVKGVVVEEERLVKDIGGTMIDFTIIEDKIAVLVKPFLGMKMGNILKGKNPFKRNLHVFSFE